MSDIIRREEFGEVALLHITTSSVDAISAAAIEAACAQMRPITVLDFDEVSFINSAGISALLKFVVTARKAGYKLFAMNARRSSRWLRCHASCLRSRSATSPCIARSAGRRPFRRPRFISTRNGIMGVL